MDIGIDLGTTFSVLAVNGRVELTPEYPSPIYLEECDVTIIPTPQGEPTFPSVVLEDPDKPDQYLFGSEALQRTEEGLAPVMFSKRKIGTREAIPQQTRSLLAKDVAREFLRHLKQCAEQALGEPVARAVVTHPAYFDRSAVEETREAAKEAGFDMSLPEQMLMEPVAAALCYTRTDKRDPLRILTYDLGGGTFDVTYLVRNGGVIEMRAFDGDHLLGGYNFDRELVQWVRKQLETRGRRVVFDEDDPEDRGRLSRLLRVAEQVKIAIAKAPDDKKMIDFRARNVVLDTNGKDVPVNERLSRVDLVALIQPYLDRTVECCRRSLQKAGVEATEVDEVLLVGGSTYGPWVAASVREAFPGTTPRLFFPDLCVGAGAAIHAKMVLPPLIAGGKYQLLLDVPETAVLETINVTGQVSDAGRPPTTPLLVSLCQPEGNTLPPLPLSADGRFLFANVQLNEGDPNRFCLKVTDRGGSCVLEHTFAVVYSPNTTETSSVSTVLPRPLYIQTLDGMAPLAKEGVPLPARCEQIFQRQNDNANISLLLYQDRDPIGEIRIENIPPEGGRDSLVELKVEITEKNQIRGMARVRTPKGKVVLETPVRVHFEPPEVPSAEELRLHFDELQGRFLQLVSADEEGSDGVAEQGLALIHEIERLFEQQPLERQEVHVALRRLHNLLHPPEDDMNPPRRVYDDVVVQCREAMREMEEKAQSVLEQARAGGDEAVDGAVVANAQKALARTGHYKQVIDRLEREGVAAHASKDRKTWARLFDALTDVLVQVQERPRMDAPPTPLGKLMASFEVMRQLALLQQQAGRLHAEGRLDDWREGLDRLVNGLRGVLREIHEMDDELPNDQARAHIQRIFARSLRPLKEDIERLGIDISHVQ